LHVSLRILLGSDFLRTTIEEDFEAKDDEDAISEVRILGLLIWEKKEISLSFRE
jgi:hypothetical protein